jgi:UDP-glucose 6-dehydrogenase
VLLPTRSHQYPEYGFKINKQLQDYDTRIKLLYGKSLQLPSIRYYQHEFLTIVTPERMSNPEFMKLLDVVYDNHNLNRLVVDEVRANPIYFYLYTNTLRHRHIVFL